VIWRKLSFGTRSERGNRFVERILTVVATCKLQGRNVLSYLTEAVQCHKRHQKAPSLLPENMAL
jgi:transposase